MNQFHECDADNDSRQEDYYQVLGVEDDASPEQIRQAYRDLVRQYHPDAGFVAGTSLLFRRVQQAYDTLMEPSRRKDYDDMLRREGKRPPVLLDLDVLAGPTQLHCLDEVQLLYLLIKITPVSSQTSPRTPLNLCLVLDRSTSMKGERLACVREATLSLADQLEPDDLFSLVAFSDRADILVTAQTNPDRRILRSTLSALRAGGGTEIYQGLVAGLSEVSRVSSAHRINHVLLLTDGHTYGDAERCLRAASAAARQNIGISAVGVGNAWNEDFLDHLASAAGGTVTYSEHPASIGPVFRRTLRDLEDAWIPDMRLNLYYDPIANHKDLFSVSPSLERLSGSETEFSLGSLPRSDTRVLLLEAIVSPQPEGFHCIVQIEVSGKVPTCGSVARRRQTIRIEFLPSTHNRSLIPATISEAVQRVSLLRMQERAQLEAQQGLLGAASARLETLSTNLLRGGYPDLAESVLREAQNLAHSGSFTDAGAKRMRYGTRSLASPKLKT
jgi:Ca-activated chloride channel homolog